MGNNIKKSILFIVLIAGLCYLLFQFFITNAKVIEPDSASLEKAKEIITAEKIKKSIDDKPLVENEKKEVVSNANASTPPPVSSASKLKLQVHGVFLHSEKRSGYALISKDSSPQRVIAIGESLSEGVFLKSLFSGGVNIDNHGKLEAYYVSDVSPSKVPPEQQSTIPLPLGNDEISVPPVIDSIAPTPPDPNVEILYPAQTRDFISSPPDGGLDPSNN